MPSPLATTDFANRNRVEPAAFSRTTLQQETSVRLEALSDTVWIGEFAGGAPGVLTAFLATGDLRRVHDPEGVNGDPVRLVPLAKDPSPDVPGAGKIYTVRPGAPTQSTAYLFRDERSNTAQAGAATTITLDAAASAVDDYYNGMIVRITGGPGAGQERMITDYVGSTKVATVATWTTNPTSASTFQIRAQVMTLTSTDYGTHVNKLSRTVDNTGLYVGLTLGWKSDTPQEELTTPPALGAALHVEYTGLSASALLTIAKTNDDATSLQLAIGSAGGEANQFPGGLPLDLTDPDYNTLQKVVDALRAVSGIDASVAPGIDPTTSSAVLEAITAKQIATVSVDTAQAGASSTITLDAGSSATNDFYNHRVITITGGTGEGQERVISDYVGSTKVATVSPDWTTTPDATSTYEIHEYRNFAWLGLLEAWINENAPRVTAARVSGATAQPAETDGAEFFSGGTYPSVSLQDYIDALQVVTDAELDGGYVFVVSTSAAVQDAVKGWIKDEKNLRNAFWRTVFAADPTTAEDPDLVIKGAGYFQDTRVQYVGQRTQGFDASGALVTRDPIDFAAMLLGMNAGAPLTTPLTRKRVNAKGLIDRPGLATREQMMNAGVTVLKDVPRYGIVIANSLTTDLAERRMPRMASETRAADFIEYNVWKTLRGLVGSWATRELVTNAEAAVVEVLEKIKADTGIISDGTNPSTLKPQPAYEPPRATFSEGVLRVSYKCRIGGEISFVAVDGAVEYQTFITQVAA